MTQEQVIANYRRKLLIFAEHHGITKACQVFNISRTGFYKIKKQFVQTGSLEPRHRRRPRMPNETTLSKKKLLLSIVKGTPYARPGILCRRIPSTRGKNSAIGSLVSSEAL